MQPATFHDHHRTPAPPGVARIVASHACARLGLSTWTTRRRRREDASPSACEPRRHTSNGAGAGHGQRPALHPFPGPRSTRRRVPGRPARSSRKPSAHPHTETLRATNRAGQVLHQHPETPDRRVRSRQRPQERPRTPLQHFAQTNRPPRPTRVTIRGSAGRGVAHETPAAARPRPARTDTLHNLIAHETTRSRQVFEANVNCIRPPIRPISFTSAEFRQPTDGAGSAAV